MALVAFYLYVLVLEIFCIQNEHGSGSIKGGREVCLIMFMFNKSLCLINGYLAVSSSGIFFDAK